VVAVVAEVLDFEIVCNDYNKKKTLSQKLRVFYLKI